MKVSVDVENFAKIKSASIDVSNYTVFVGENNSGKTFMLQLIYGLLKYFSVPDEYEPIHTKDLLDRFIQNERSEIMESDLELLCLEFNNVLNEVKEKLIHKIFQKDIEIGSIHLNCSLFDEKMEIVHGIEYTPMDENSERTEFKKWSIYISGMEKAFFGLVHYKESYGTLLNLILFSFGIGRNNKVFIPASRTGIQLLYKEFYARKVDNILMMDEQQNNNHLGLTLPVYDFLRFLQTYNADQFRYHSGNVGFIEKSLLSGKIASDKMSNLEYIPDGSSLHVPLYLASSMINELAPIVMALSTGTFCDVILIDEVETSLHPQKQREMARLLTRINNQGTKLVVSTHSDTMAMYINLFTLLSKNKHVIPKVLKEYDLDENDVLSNNEVHFYQFSNLDGISVVEELEYSRISSIGVDFGQFNASLDQIYDLSKAVMEVE